MPQAIFPWLPGLASRFSLLALALITAAYLPRTFLVYLLLYLVTTLAYSLALKRIVLVDVVILSSLYTIRMLAGSAATRTPVSPWLAAFSIFLFLSLAMVKRFSELQNLHARGVNPTNGRGYLLSDIEQLRSFGTSSAYASIVIFALYINGRDVVALYHHPSRMWLITPLLILWVSRVWLLASRGLLDEDPVVFALTDRMSLLLGLGVVLVAYSRSRALKNRTVELLEKDNDLCPLARTGRSLNPGAAIQGSPLKSAPFSGKRIFLRPLPPVTKMLAVGMGRSYGDVCLLQNGTLLRTPNLDRLISFDSQTGLLRCEAGVTLAEILDFAVPRGWFLPVSPGTKYVTVGGAIANDIHGKNHHVAGTFGLHTPCFELVRSDGTQVVCSATRIPSGTPLPSAAWD